MQFGEQIKEARKALGLTQEQMANQLGISRQAVSNWENDRNLPDIEMLINMACTFHLSLDELILGGRNMANNNTKSPIANDSNPDSDLAQKLIRDGSEAQRSKWIAITVGIGAVLFAASICLFAMRATSPDITLTNGNIAESGFGYTAFGMLSFLASLITFLGVGASAIVRLIKNREKHA